MTYKAIFYSACLLSSMTLYSMNIQHSSPLNMQPANTMASIKPIPKQQEYAYLTDKSKLRISFCLFPFVAAATVTPILYYYLRYSEEDCCNC